MEFNYRKLKGRIVEYYGSQRQFAKLLGISNEGFCKKMRGKTPFGQVEMVTISELLDFPISEIPKYFFCLDDTAYKAISKEGRT